MQGGLLREENLGNDRHLLYHFRGGNRRKGDRKLASDGFLSGGNSISTIRLRPWLLMYVVHERANFN